jgi:hypothetical protein
LSREEQARSDAGKLLTLEQRDGKNMFEQYLEETYPA